MQFMEIIDLLFIASYFAITSCFILLILSEETKGFLHRLREGFYHGEISTKKDLEHTATSNPPDGPQAYEERREKAIKYLVLKYIENKKREEEFSKKLENYGRVRRWVYERSRSIKTAHLFFINSIVKPSIIFAMVYSTALSMYLGMRVGPSFVQLTKTYIPFPFNYLLDVLILFPIGFSPGIISIVLGYYLEKKKLRTILEDYGVTM